MDLETGKMDLETGKMDLEKEHVESWNWTQGLSDHDLCYMGMGTRPLFVTCHKAS